MELNSTYWFHKYDQESFEKEFQRIQFYHYNLTISQDPLFSQLKQIYEFSENRLEKNLQQVIQQIITFLSEIFSHESIDYNKNLEWVQFCKTVRSFIDCENLYSIIFWKLTYVNGFIPKRIFSFFIRLFKFVMALQTSLFATLNKVQRNIANLKKNHNQLNISIEKVNFIRDQLSENLTQAINQFRKNQYSSGKEINLLKKLQHFVTNFTEKSLIELKQESDIKFGNLENKLAQDILQHNEISIKSLDKYFQDYQEENVQKYQENSQILGNSDYLTQVSEDIQLQYRPEEDEKKRKVRQINIENVKKIEKRMMKKNKIKQQKNQFNISLSDRTFTTEATNTTEMGEEEEDEDQQVSVRTSFLKGLATGDQFRRNQKQKYITYHQLERYKESPNNPQNAKGAVIYTYIQDMYQIEKDQAKKKSTEKNRIMKRGGETLEEIKTALNQKTNTKEKDNKKQKMTEINEEDENDSIDSDDSFNSFDSLEILNDRLTGDLMNYIEKADASIIAIKPEDIKKQNQKQDENVPKYKYSEIDKKFAYADPNSIEQSNTDKMKQQQQQNKKQHLADQQAKDPEEIIIEQKDIVYKRHKTMTATINKDQQKIKKKQQKDIVVGPDEKLYEFYVQEHRNQSEPPDPYLFDNSFELDLDNDDESEESEDNSDLSDQNSEDEEQEEDEENSQNSKNSDENSNSSDNSEDSDVFQDREQAYTDGQKIKQKKRREKRRKRKQSIKLQKKAQKQEKEEPKQQIEQPQDRIKLPIHQTHQNREKTFMHFLQESEKQTQNFHKSPIPELNSTMVTTNLLPFNEGNYWAPLQTFITQKKVISIVDNIIDIYQKNRKITEENTREEGKSFIYKKPRYYKNFKQKQFATIESLPHVHDFQADNINFM